MCIVFLPNLSCPNFNLACAEVEILSKNKHTNLKILIICRLNFYEADKFLKVECTGVRPGSKVSSPPPNLPPHTYTQPILTHTHTHTHTHPHTHTHIHTMEALITVTGCQCRKYMPNVWSNSHKETSPQRSPPINSQKATWYCPNV